MGGFAEAQASEESAATAMAEYEKWINVIAEFTRGVEFDEGNIHDMLQYWPEMDDLAVMNREDDAGGTASEFAGDVKEILADSEYQNWARGHGLDPEDWLRKSMRVTSVYIMQQMEAQREMMASQRQSYEAMLEQTCAQVDQETCEQMRATMIQSMATGEAMMGMTEKLPAVTPAELALLQQYGSELESIMSADEEGDDFYSDYEDYED